MSAAVSVTKTPAQLTGWIPVSTPPLTDRPGRYQVRYGGPRGAVRLAVWTGSGWADPHIRAVYGDAWRGLCAQQALP